MQEPIYYTIILVEDDERLARLVAEFMQGHGFEIEHIARGDMAVAQILKKQPDLVILDVMLPGMDGFEICRQVRSQYQNPIMMLTAKDEDVDQIVGLEIGADDYVTKPVEPRVLLARIKSLLRRSKSNADVAAVPKFEQRLNIGGLDINAATRQVLFCEQEIRLTGSEFDLLWFLSNHAGQILSRDALYQQVSGIDYDGVDRAMDIRISRLRKLMDQHPNINVQIKTVRSKGYLLVTTDVRDS